MDTSWWDVCGHGLPAEPPVMPLALRRRVRARANRHARHRPPPCSGAATRTGKGRVTPWEEFGGRFKVSGLPRSATGRVLPPMARLLARLADVSYRRRGRM